MAKKKWTFEQAMEKLEQIVEQLETQEVSLEESVQLYKEGMALADICKQKITMRSEEQNRKYCYCKKMFLEK